MKCSECGGTGKVQKWFYERTGFGKCEKVCGDVKCEWCNGTGEVEQTEEEYIQTCTTEELAKWLSEHLHCGDCDIENRTCAGTYGGCKETLIRWLKQPHREENEK